MTANFKHVLGGFEKVLVKLLLPKVIGQAFESFGGPNFCTLCFCIYSGNPHYMYLNLRTRIRLGFYLIYLKC